MIGPAASSVLSIHPAGIVFPYLLDTKSGNFPDQFLRERLVIGNLYGVLAGFKLGQLCL